MRSSVIDEDQREDERRQRQRIASLLAEPLLDASDAIALVGHVVDVVRRADWKQVAQDCQSLAAKSDLCGWTQDRSWADSPYTSQAWEAFWFCMQGRAEEKLNPNDLRELYEAREDEAAVARLKAYFFGSALWNSLPERARRSLADADRTWFSSRAGRPESVLDHLKVAAEALCYSLIWEPLRNARGDQRLFEFHNRDLALRDKGHNPALPDYAWACRRPFLSVLFDPAYLGDEGRTFLTSDLPNALIELNALRNPAQHDPRRAWRRENVEPIFESFVGLGCGGILPRLAEISRRLVAQQHRARDVPGPRHKYAGRHQHTANYT